MANTFQLAVIGNPIAHSQSPKIHAHFAKQFGLSIDYQKIQITSFEKLVEFLQQAKQQFTGLNITLPHKESVYQIATENQWQVSQSATLAQAVNTLSFNDQPSAAITDGFGFRNHLKRLNQPLTDRNILIIGAGGATRGLISAMGEFNQRIFLTNRTTAKAEALAKQYQIHHFQSNQSPQQPIFDIVINATSMGVSKDQPTNSSTLLNFLSADNITPTTFFYDLFYSHGQPTPFIHLVNQLFPNNPVSDGYGMLVEQAALSFTQWFHQTPSTQQLYSI